jgi:putative ABC transport system substrate-binding protein
MKRRGLLVGGGASVVWPTIARAQGKTYRVGLVASDTTVPGGVDAFRDELKKLGYVEGRNLVLDVRWPKTLARTGTGPGARDGARRPDVIASWTTPPTRAVQAATSTIPIVMMSIGDPVGAGLVKSLARPGGNITGVSNQDAEVVVKAVELFREVVPGLQRMGVVYNPLNPSAVIQISALEGAMLRLRPERAGSARRFGQTTRPPSRAFLRRQRGHSAITAPSSFPTPRPASPAR